MSKLTPETIALFEQHVEAYLDFVMQQQMAERLMRLMTDQRTVKLLTTEASGTHRIINKMYQQAVDRSNASWLKSREARKKFEDIYFSVPIEARGDFGELYLKVTELIGGELMMITSKPKPVQSQFVRR
jgi:hypothetical protein